MSAYKIDLGKFAHRIKIGRDDGFVLAHKDGYEAL